MPTVFGGCDNDVVDNQVAIMEFETGATATLSVIGGCALAVSKNSEIYLFERNFTYIYQARSCMDQFT